MKDMLSTCILEIPAVLSTCMCNNCLVASSQHISFFLASTCIIKDSIFDVVSEVTNSMTGIKVLVGKFLLCIVSSLPFIL